MPGVPSGLSCEVQPRAQIATATIQDNSLAAQSSLPNATRELDRPMPAVAGIHLIYPALRDRQRQPCLQHETLQDIAVSNQTDFQTKADLEKV